MAIESSESHFHAEPYVYISSSKVDLAAYRDVARDAVLAFDGFPVLMEYQPEMQHPATEECLSKVDQVDIFIGIYAHQYGYCPEGNDISIQEMEFDRATANGIPRLCFLLDEQFPWPTQHIEGEPGRSKLQQFKQKIVRNADDHVFTTPESFELAIIRALRQVQQRLALEVQIGRYLVHDITRPTLKDADPLRAQLLLLIEESDTSFNMAAFSEALSAKLAITSEDIVILQVNVDNTLVKLELPTQSAIDLYVSGLQAMAKRLEERNRLMRKFVAGLGFDLKSPLSVIAVHMGLLKNDPNRSETSAMVIDRAIETMVSHIHALTAWASDED